MKKKQNNIKQKKLKDGTIKYEVSFMYKGMRYKKTFTDIADCRIYESEIKRYVDMYDKPFIECNKTLTIVIDEWYESKVFTLADNTKNNYSNMIKKVKNHPSNIAKQKIRHLGYRKMQSFFDKLCSGNGKQTCIGVKSVLSMVFKYAQKCSYIESNPISLCELRFKESKQKVKQEDTITYNQLQAIANGLLKNGKNDFVSQSLTILCYVMYFTGARVSEALCLEKSDFDFVNHTVTFNKQLSNSKVAEMKPVELKTVSSYATIPIPLVLESILKEWFEVNKHELVVCTKDGKYISYDRWYYRIKSVREELNFNFHAHQLRHAFGSNLAMENVNIKSVQAMMRHQNIKTTMDTYVKSSFTKEADEVNRVFNDFSDRITPNLHLSKVN